MKKILFTILAFAMWGTIVMAQKDQRTLSTKIADLLAQMPAKDSAHLSDNMKEIAVMGESGLSGIAELLSEPGKGDNSKPEYAINGFSYYVTQPGREDWRRMSERAYCQALTKVPHPVNKAFIISQLQIVGQSDEAVSCLKNYLNDHIGNDFWMSISGSARRTNSKVDSSLGIENPHNSKGNSL